MNEMCVCVGNIMPVIYFFSIETVYISDKIAKPSINAEKKTQTIKVLIVLVFRAQRFGHAQSAAT